MVDAGDLEVNNVKCARMQMLTVEKILEGKRFHTPTVFGKSVGAEIL